MHGGELIAEYKGWLVWTIIIVAALLLLFGLYIFLVNAGKMAPIAWIDKILDYVGLKPTPPR